MHLSPRFRGGAALGVTFALAMLSAEPRESHAQSSPPGDAAKLYGEGIKLMADGKPGEAEQKLQASWDIKPSLDTATNLGELEMQVGQYVEAATHLDYALRNMLHSLPPDLKARIETLAKKSRARVAAITLTVEPAGAQVALDGKPVGQAPLSGPVFASAGAHELSAQLSGHARKVEKVDAVEGAEQSVTIRLEREVAGSPSVPPGERGNGPPAAAWVLLIGGSALAVGGGVMLGVGLGSQSSAGDDVAAIVAEGGSCEPAATGFEARCEEASSTESTGNTLAGIGVASLGVGVAAAVGGLVWIVLHEDAPGETAIVPMLGPQTNGVWLQQSF